MKAIANGNKFNKNKHSHICLTNWHYENFASFDLLDEKGKSIVSSKKQAFCLVDVIRITRRHGGPETPYYLEEVCEESPVSGISVGWADIYTEGLPGQFIDITNVPNGVYKQNLIPLI